MKYFIKLGVLGLAMSLGITACTYQQDKEILRVKDTQNSVGLVLGDSHSTYIYNVKQAQYVYLYAPTGYKIVSGNEKKEYYKKYINPQDSIHLKFKIVKDGDNISKAEDIDKVVITYKEEYKPSYQEEIKNTGKSTNRVGDNNYFKIEKPNQKDIVIDLHEYNRDEIHKFNYVGVKNDMRLKLIAPKYHAFIFEGKAYKEYNLNMKKDSEVQFSMKLKADWDNSDDTYRRHYYIKLKK